MSNNALPSRNRLVLLAGSLLIYRLVNAFSLATFFQPDEYFQTLEPAWKCAFGRSQGAWITWEWHEHLRSSISPLLFCQVFRVADTIGIYMSWHPTARSTALIIAPKALQAILAALIDVFTFRLAQKIYGVNRRVHLAALALTVLSPWQWFCSVRTLSNSLETALTIIALDYWPWRTFLLSDVGSTPKTNSSHISSRRNEGFNNSGISTDYRSLAMSLVLAAVACILRPTNVIIWATIVIALMSRRNNWNKVLDVLISSIICGSSVLALSVAMDMAFYGQLTFPPFRFMYFNLVQSLAVFYGSNRSDYYLTEGLPLLLTTALPFAVYGMWSAIFSARNKSPSRFSTGILRVLALAVMVTVLALSLISHKEVRFIYPLLPLLHISASEPIAQFLHPFPIPKKNSRAAILLVGVLTNIFIASYASFVHQRGVIDVMHFLRHEHEHKVSSFQHNPVGATPTTSVAFLMPCHSTPWRSHLVYASVDAWALTCEPPINLSMEQRNTYLDEADVFYADPVQWIDDNMQDRAAIAVGEPHSNSFAPSNHLDRPWPEYVVFFEQLEPTMKRVLNGTQYRECWRGFNTHWHDDWRRQGDVIVWCRN